MWSPTHLVVTVQRAKGLLTKGKNGTNNCFVTISIGKEKYQTSIKDKCDSNVDWNEECELKIPDQGNRAELVLTCLHRNNIGLDEFLGQVTLPLNEMETYDRSMVKWYKLESKPGKEKKNKDRGELEVRIRFIVKSGSLSDLNKKEKHKSSIEQFTGSLLSIEKRKGIKKFAASLGSRMHLHHKKKHDKDSDNISYGGSTASIGTPNSGPRQHGLRGFNADPGVGPDEEDDEFVLNNLSPKSSASSLNMRPQLLSSDSNYVPKNPSPLLNVQGKKKGKRHDAEEINDNFVDPELEKIENDFSVRRRTLPPPSKPPRITPQQGSEIQTLQENAVEKEQIFNEWEAKLYNGKHLDIGCTDSLKRRSWEQSRVPLPQAPEETEEDEYNDVNLSNTVFKPSKNSSSSEDNEDMSENLETENFPNKIESVEKPKEFLFKALPKTEIFEEQNSTLENKNDISVLPTYDHKTSKIFDNQIVDKWHSQTFIEEESKSLSPPQPMPRNQTNEVKMSVTEEENKVIHDTIAEEEKKTHVVEEEEVKFKFENDALQKQNENKPEDPQKLREARRLAEDERILNFAKRSISGESDEYSSTTTPEQSPIVRANSDKREKRSSKYKVFNNARDVSQDRVNVPSSGSPSNQRIIIGHEKSASHAERRSEMSAALAKKYEGKSREELMLIANGMENEALMQRQRVKELEDYLDNLLLRVMETHPKILQNPYCRTTSAKSG